MSKKQRRQVATERADKAPAKRAKPLPKGSSARTTSDKLLSARVEERGRQVVRLLRIVRALEAARYGLTVQQLIEQAVLDCSERTVYRDLDHLAQVGFQ